MTKKSVSGNFKVWVMVLGIIVVLGTLVLLAVLKKPMGSKQNYGSLLDAGLLDSWEYKYGKASFSFEGEDSKIRSHSIYITDQTNFIRTETVDGNSISYKKLNSNSGKLSEITEGIFVEVYLDENLKGIAGTAKTIIYWE